ncbi:MAG: DUF2339 domain-containing protein, partial [Acidobacteria bacterium]|nr:DUF2339 domain-containing protein [Acidobacteriota bacterium]
MDSQPDLKLLIEEVRELKRRVERLEQLSRPASAAQPSIPAAGVLHISPPIKRGHAGLETRIGSHWLNRAGIAAVMIGVSYFLKFAFENHWIGPVSLVLTGLVAGIALVIWSERFRRAGYRIFSYSLKAVGIGVLYLSIWAAFQVYHLVPASVAFLSMVVVTGASCGLALLQDTETLAMFAITGGLSTPLLLSTGENREVALFSYLVVLDFAVLVLALRRPWRRLPFLAFAGTLILYLIWYAEFYDRTQVQTTFIFSSIFFLIFALLPVLMEGRGAASDIAPMVLALANAATYFLDAYAIMVDLGRAAMAPVASALAALYLLFEWPTKSTARSRPRLRLTHRSLAVFFVTAAIAIHFESHWITVGWLLEAAALFWIGTRIRSDLLNLHAIAILTLAICRLLFVDRFEPTHLVFNPRIGVYAVAILVLAVFTRGASKRADRPAGIIRAVALAAMNGLAIVAFSLEVSDYYGRQLAAVSVPVKWQTGSWPQVRSLEIGRDFTYSALWMAYGGILMAAGFWRSSPFLRWQALVLIAVTTLKVFLYDISRLDRVYRILSLVVLGVL